MPCGTGGPAWAWVSAGYVRKPSGEHGRAKLIAQGINRLGNCCPSVLPHVICKTKILTYLEIIGIISISVISVIKCNKCYNMYEMHNLFGLSLSFESQMPEDVVDQR